MGKLSIKEAIKQYISSFSDIMYYFDECPNINTEYGLIDMTSYWWYYGISGVLHMSYSYPKNLEADFFLYLGTLIEKEEYCLAWCENRRDVWEYVLLNSNKRVYD